MWLRQHLATLPTHDLVIFADAYDVIATKAAAHAATTFASFSAAIVFGCEVEAAPDAAVAHHLLATSSSFPLPPLPHLNSGLFMGSAGALVAMLAEVSRDVAAHHSDFAANADVDDQRFFWRFYLRHRFDEARSSSGTRSSHGMSSDSGMAAVALDTAGLLFHSFHGVDPTALRVADAHTGALVSDHTGTAPAFLHGNAGGRAALAAATEALRRPGAWLSELLS
jgi:hypothetical protein